MVYNWYGERENPKYITNLDNINYDTEEQHYSVYVC